MIFNHIYQSYCKHVSAYISVYLKAPLFLITSSQTH